jgi:hypothetical protein
MARLQSSAAIAIAGTLAGVLLAAGNSSPRVLSAFLMWRTASYPSKLAARAMVGATAPLARSGSWICCHQPVSVADQAATGRQLLS